MRWVKSKFNASFHELSASSLKSTYLLFSHQVSLPKVKSAQTIGSIDDISKGSEDDEAPVMLHVQDFPKKENGDMRTLLVHHAANLVQALAHVSHGHAWDG